MIGVDDESEFTLTIADLIKTLAKLDVFTLKVWIGSDLPMIFTESDDYYFMQESVRIITDSTVEYIFYDIITGLVIEYDKIEGLDIGYC